MTIDGQKMREEEGMIDQAAPKRDSSTDGGAGPGKEKEQRGE